MKHDSELALKQRRPLMREDQCLKLRPALRRNVEIFKTAPIIAGLQARHQGRRHVGQCWVGTNIYEHALRREDSPKQHVLIARYLEGGQIGLADGAPVSSAIGDVVLLDFGRSLCGLQMRSLVQYVWVPYPAIAFDPNAHPAFLSLGQGPAPAAPLHQQFDRIFGRATHAADLPSIPAVDDLISTVQTLLETGMDVGEVRSVARASLGERIRRYIEAHLQDPDLSVAGLLSRFGVSRATLFRIFEPFGGVRQYISNRRLFRAVLQLSRNPGLRGEISKAAMQWGYSSEASFNRTVRRAFGVSPSALFKRSQSPLSQLDGADYAKMPASEIAQ